jgi:hypothetical protein
MHEWDESLAGRVEKADPSQEAEVPQADLVGGGLLSKQARPRPVEDMLNLTDTDQAPTNEHEAAEQPASNVLAEALGLGSRLAKALDEGLEEGDLTAIVDESERNTLSEQEQGLVANMESLLDQLEEQAVNLSDSESEVLGNIRELVGQLKGTDQQARQAMKAMREGLQDAALEAAKPFEKLMAQTVEIDRALTTISKGMGLTVLDPKTFDLDAEEKRIVKHAKWVGARGGMKTLGTGVDMAFRHVKRNQAQLRVIVKALDDPRSNMEEAASVMKSVGSKMRPRKPVVAWDQRDVQMPESPADGSHENTRSIFRALFGDG